MSDEPKNEPGKSPSEFELITRLKTKLPVNDSVVTGAGDDCAVIYAGVPGKLQLHTTDAVVQGVHFSRETDPKKVGHKALGRALSDIAAMAGTPRWATITLGLPDGFDGAMVETIYEGIGNLAKRHEVAIVGGETVSIPERLVISVAVVGEVERNKCVLRSGAKPGDIPALVDDAFEASQFIRQNVAQSQLNDRGNYELTPQPQHIHKGTTPPPLPCKEDFNR